MTDHGGIVMGKHHRSPHWAALEKEFLAENPNCVISGRSDILRQVHHIIPYEYCMELDRPDLELNKGNLLTIGADPHENFHLYVVHGGYFASFILDVQPLIKVCQGKPLHDIIALAYWHEEVKNRVKPLHLMNAHEKQQLRQIMDHRYPLKPT